MINANFEIMYFGRGLCISIDRLEKDLSCKAGLRYFEIHFFYTKRIEQQLKKLFQSEKQEK